MVSCLIVITGAFGIFGACNDNKCLLHLFWILLAVWTCGFIAAGIIAVLLPSKVLNEGCTSPTISGIADFNTLSINAVNSQFCKTACECYIANSAQRVLALGEGMTQTSSDTTKADNVNDCPLAAGWTPTLLDSVFAALEKSFQCSGWCPRTGLFPNYPVFYFSDNIDSSNFVLI